MTAEKTKSLGGRRKRCGAAVVILYTMILGAVVAGCADRLILYPTTERLMVDGIDRHTITVDGKTVEIWSCKSAGVANGRSPQAYVLAFTGNAARAELTAPFFRSRLGVASR